MTCPWCGACEPNDYLLQINHWVREIPEGEYDWCKAHGMCIAMRLTQTHVVNAGQKVRAGFTAGRADLARAIARAEEVWPERRAAWLMVWRPLLREIEAPEHHTVSFEADDAALFEVAS